MNSTGLLPIVAPDDLKRRLKWLMLFRVSLASLIGLGFVIVQYSTIYPPFSMNHASSIVSTLLIIYAINLLYIFVIERAKNIIVISYLQMSSDVCMSAILIGLTGGLESPILFLFTINVLLGALLLERQGAWFVVILTFGAIILLGIHEVSLLNFNRLASASLALKDILTSALINVAIICFVATLAGYLGQQVRTADLRVRVLNANLKTLQHLNEHLLMSMKNGLIYLNHKGYILFVNRALEELLQRSASDILGHSIDQVIDQVPDTFLKLLESPSKKYTYSVHSTYHQRQFQWEQYLHFEQQSTAVISCSLFDLQNPVNTHTPQDWVLMIQDVTELRKMEQSIQRKEHLASIGEMAAQIAHEIRNPLASMSNSIQLLTPQLSHDPLSCKLLGIMERETDRLSNLTQEFLNFARPQKIQAQKFDFTLLVQDISTLSDVTILHDEVQHSMAYIDPNHIKQILWNIIRNSIEADATLIEISQHLNTINVQGHELSFYTVYLVDNGTGIDQPTQIFEPFYTSKEQGSGLGLALCRGLIEAHAGSIEAKSRAHQGSVITFTMPADQFSLKQALQMQYNISPIYTALLIERWQIQINPLTSTHKMITLS